MKKEAAANGTDWRIAMFLRNCGIVSAVVSATITAVCVYLLSFVSIEDETAFMLIFVFSGLIFIVSVAVAISMHADVIMYEGTNASSNDGQHNWPETDQ